ILLKTTLSDPEVSAEEKDSIRRIVVDYTKRKSFNITNLKIEGDPEKLKGKKKRFYHISNFSVSFAFNELFMRDIKTEYNLQRSYAGSFAYVFNNRPKAFEPFKNLKFLKNKAFQIIKDVNVYLAPTMVSFRTDMQRKYQQTLIRDITQQSSAIDPNFKKDFIWNRNYDLKYSITKGLKFEFSANNKARIDEPFGIMDKNDPEYRAKRDTIWQNILDLGRNVNYNHLINASYNIPINKLPLLRWTSATARYKGTYEWTAGPITADTINIGNTIANSNSINLNGTLNFSKVYDKVPFLKNISDKMRRGAKSNKKYKDVKFNKESVKLKKDVGKTIVHNLLTEEVQIKVTDDAGKEVDGELIIVNNKKVKFRAKESHDNTNIEITGKREVKDNIFRAIGEGLVYAAIGLKNVSLSYTETSGTIFPGYMPNTNYLGLNKVNQAPGIPFILGVQNERFGYDALNAGWLTTDTLQTSPYQMTFSSRIDAKATLEPLKGLKIDLSANKTNSKNRNEYNLAEEGERLFTGNFSMSYLMVNTSFWKFGNNYSSEAFENFKTNRFDIAWRLANKRNQARLADSPDYDINQPNLDPTDNTPLEDGFPNGYGPTSQEVMIPAFLAAYAGRSTDNVELSPFPKIPLPNWRITYDGLSEIDLVKRVIKTISLSHSYSSSYNVGSYTTNANYNWYDANYDGFSWARDEVNRLFIPEQLINSVTLTEAFNPLVSADITWLNNLNSKFEYNKGRSMTLSFSNNQVVDLISSEIIIGLGYRFDQLPIIIKTGKGNQQKFQSDLNLRGDLSIRDMLTIIRKIEEGVDQITAGQKAMSLKLSADYALNERFNLKLFYDHAITTPRISTSFRTSNIKFGISVRFTLIP
ncbi:MAG: cell surface protein SprA, partial [Bacteroidales bacterium]|nr:cell surface protein SprA [Bacteroidales bacterium]